MLYNYGSYSIVIIGLVIFCLVHSYRRGTLSRWIFMLILLPVIGCLYYIYSEIISNRNSFKVKTINPAKTRGPSVSIKKLEDELHFTDTFTNRVRLADAYLAAGQTDKAIDLYKASLTGAFAENEHVIAQLITAYYEQQRFEEVIPLAKKIYKLQQFPRSKAHLLYALALENTGNIEQAETEFKAMKGRFSYFEQRYQYGLFLMRQDRDEDAWNIFNDMLNEEPHLGAVEKKANRIWFIKTKEELRKINVQKMV